MPEAESVLFPSEQSGRRQSLATQLANEPLDRLLWRARKVGVKWREATRVPSQSHSLESSPATLSSCLWPLSGGLETCSSDKDGLEGGQMAENVANKDACDQ